MTSEFGNSLIDAGTKPYEIAQRGNRPVTLLAKQQLNFQFPIFKIHYGSKV